MRRQRTRTNNELEANNSSIRDSIESMKRLQKQRSGLKRQSTVMLTDAIDKTGHSETYYTFTGMENDFFSQKEAHEAF